MGKKTNIDDLIDRSEYELIIPGYPKGSDITLLNCNYIKNYIKDDNGKSIVDDFMYIVYKDNKTGEKKYYIINSPKFTFYIIDKEKYNVPDHVLAFLEKDKLIPITCEYKNLLRVIAELTDKLQFFYDNIRARNMSANNALHLDPSVLGSDVHIEDFYRFLFSKSYINNAGVLSKAFLDIEVDGRYSMYDFPKSGECPINAVSYLDEKSKMSYQLLLKNNDNPLIEEYMKSFENGSEYKKIKEFVMNTVGKTLCKKYDIGSINYEIIFFDSEVDLLEALFDIINNTNPDMLMIYNMAFDLSYIIDRLVELGKDPIDFMTNKKVHRQFLNYYVDENNMNELAERGDSVKISSYTVWIDQMISFASIRKGRAKFQSFKLDDIGEAVAGVKKLDYSNITTDIKMLPYLNYRIFSYYNIMDTMVQYCIEKCTKDCEYVFAKALVNNTRYNKVHRQSIYLMNRFKSEYDDMGIVLGNNKNAFKSISKTKFPGAMVGNPLNNDKSVYMKVDGHPTTIVNNLVDFDYAKLYPSCIEENNISSNTQIGKIIIDKQVSKYEHTDMYTAHDEEDDISRYSRGGEFLENIMSGNMITFFHKWFNLANFSELIEDMKDMFPDNNYESMDSSPIWFTDENSIDAIDFINSMYSGDVYKEAINFIYSLEDSEKENYINKIKEHALL